MQQPEQRTENVQELLRSQTSLLTKEILSALIWPLFVSEVKSNLLPEDVKELMKQPEQRSEKVQELLKKENCLGTQTILSVDKAYELSKELTGLKWYEVYHKEGHQGARTDLTFSSKLGKVDAIQLCADRVGISKTRSREEIWRRTSKGRGKFGNK